MEVLEFFGLAGRAQELTAGAGQNPARQSAIKAGLPVEVPAMTVNMVCGSSLKAIMLGAQAIKSGDSNIVIAGGQENMSMSPHVLQGSRNGLRMGDGKLIDSMIVDGLWDVYNDYHMGITAENVATKYGISRREQDEFALASQGKAEAAQKAGRFVDEIVPYSIKNQKRRDRRRYRRISAPWHHAGNACRPAPGVRQGRHRHGGQCFRHQRRRGDGDADVRRKSAATWPETARHASRLTQRPASIPSVMGLGPISASKRCLQLAGWSANDVELMEINEAFAAQAIAVNRELGWDTARVNVNGGAIAIGHPIGASGARILVSLLHEMARRDATKGLASLCIGGGMGVALAVER